MYEKCIEALGIAASECVYIDDRLGNVTRAVELGMTGILDPSHSELGTQYLEKLLQAMGILN